MDRRDAGPRTGGELARGDVKARCIEALGLGNERSVIQRILFPPAEWKNLYQLANQNGSILAQASARLANEFQFKGIGVLAYKPTWESKTHPGYSWYSRRGLASGRKAIETLMETGYGLNVNGRLITKRDPRRVR